MGEAGRTRGMSMFTLGRQIDSYARLLGDKGHLSEPPHYPKPEGGAG